MKKRVVLVMLVSLFLVGLPLAALSEMSVPQAKQTSLGLYLTAKEAYAKWQADPDKIKVLDVRTPGEYIFVGHAPMAVNLPIKLLKFELNPKNNHPVMPDNEHFIEQVKKKFAENDTILVMCRSGSRSAAAVNAMAEAGYKNVYNIIDGFEGDALDVPGSYNNGMRIVNGWRNSGAPWTYKLDAARMVKRFFAPFSMRLQSYRAACGAMAMIAVQPVTARVLNAEADTVDAHMVA